MGTHELRQPGAQRLQVRAAAAMAEVAGASIWEGAWTVGLMRPPRLKLRAPRLSLPGPMACFALSFALYFIVISGSVHNVILEPPSMGQMLDPASQKPKPVVFVEGRINGQYIIEGLSAGFFCALGGAGLIMIDVAQDPTMASKMSRYCACRCTNIVHCERNHVS